MTTNPDIPTTEDQRTCLKAELRVYYGPSQKMVLYGFSVDMSSGGLFLKTETRFSIDERVMLSFTLPDVNKTINCRAKVAWVNSIEEPSKPELPPGIGLQFLDLSTEYLMSIQSLLKHDGVEPVSEPAK
ncbi:MAG: PilZ domain-containing protein [Desulfuromonadales bacterium]|nr:PilZ domain-containing protein [Desulfuromonadales bacterium]